MSTGKSIDFVNKNSVRVMYAYTCYFLSGQSLTVVNSVLLAMYICSGKPIIVTIKNSQPF